MRYGFIGLGNLGKHLAANLVRGGFEVAVHDLDRAAAAGVLAAGATWAGSVAELARSCDALITCLPSPKATAMVMDQALPAMRRGSTWIEMSTNDFAEVEALATRASAAAIDTLACPVTGGVHRAEAGEITVLVGGAPAIFEKHKPALQAMGGKVIYLGGIEQAAVTKVVTNMLAFIHLIAAGEAMMLCAKAGVDLRAAFEAIAASSGNSFVHETESQVILNGSRDISFTMDLVIKDVSLFDSIARQHHVPLELSPLIVDIFKEGERRYGPREFSPNIIRRLEDACHVRVLGEGFPAQMVDDEPEAPGYEVVPKGRTAPAAAA